MPHITALQTVLLFLIACGAGLYGSLVGIGGGILIVPILTVGFGLDIRYAVGASLISIIATSSGAAAAYVRDHLTNIRVGMVMEIATTAGALSGALLAGLLAPALVFIVFGMVVLFTVSAQLLKGSEELPQGVTSSRLALWLRLPSSYPDKRLGREVTYAVRGVPQSFSVMYVAGILSGLLGIGSGPFKVLAMDTFMKLPVKVSTTTSNFMIGVTAAASAGIYFLRGDIDPLVAGPVALGVLAGALVGARVLASLSNVTLRRLFVVVLLLVGVQMIVRGVGMLHG